MIFGLKTLHCKPRQIRKIESCFFKKKHDGCKSSRMFRPLDPASNFILSIEIFSLFNCMFYIRGPTAFLKCVCPVLGFANTQHPGYSAFSMCLSHIISVECFPVCVYGKSFINFWDLTYNIIEIFQNNSCVFSRTFTHKAKGN